MQAIGAYAASRTSLPSESSLLLRLMSSQHGAVHRDDTWTDSASTEGSSASASGIGVNRVGGEDENSREWRPPRAHAGGRAEVGSGGGSVLSRFGRDLTSEARRGELDPCIGREDVIQRTLQVLTAERTLCL